MRSDNSTQSSNNNININNTPSRKRLLNILLNTNSSTTEDDTEEESIPTVNTSKRTRRRRRNFSSSTSSSYTSSSLTTNSNSNNITNVAASSTSSQQPQPQSSIAYRTRSRTQSVDHSEIDSPSTKKSAESKRRSSTKKIANSSDREECKKALSEFVNSTTTTTTASTKKSRETSQKSAVESSTTETSQQQQQQVAFRKLRSHQSKVGVRGEDEGEEEDIQESKHNLRRKTQSQSPGVIPKKRQRFDSRLSKELDTRVNSKSKTLKEELGARLARGREPQFVDQDLSQPSTSAQLVLGHPPSTQGTSGTSQNLLRRSSRGKTSYTTGSCVSFSHFKLDLIY